MAASAHENPFGDDLFAILMAETEGALAEMKNDAAGSTAADGTKVDDDELEELLFADEFDDAEFDSEEFQLLEESDDEPLIFEGLDDDDKFFLEELERLSLRELACVIDAGRSIDWDAGERGIKALGAASVEDRERINELFGISVEKDAASVLEQVRGTLYLDLARLVLALDTPDSDELQIIEADSGALILKVTAADDPPPFDCLYSALTRLGAFALNEAMNLRWADGVLEMGADGQATWSRHIVHSRLRPSLRRTRGECSPRARHRRR